jgi:hypothetical protein
MKPSDDRALGSVTHRQHGTFDFDLPLSSPTIRQISFGETQKGLRGDPARPSRTSRESLRRTSPCTMRR